MDGGVEEGREWGLSGGRLRGVIAIIGWGSLSLLWIKVRVLFASSDIETGRVAARLLEVRLPEQRAACRNRGKMGAGATGCPLARGLGWSVCGLIQSISCAGPRRTLIRRIHGDRNFMEGRFADWWQFDSHRTKALKFLFAAVATPIHARTSIRYLARS